MAGKITCESCGTEFMFEIAKDFDNCPVCGVSFHDETDSTDNDDENDVQNEGLMCFFKIAADFTDPDDNGVWARCSECETINILTLDKFDKVVDGKYAILKENVPIICRKCGKEHKPRKILYKERVPSVPPLPRCPLCHSLALKKITTGSRLLAAATLGVFALPYNNKTFECQDCGYRF